MNLFMSTISTSTTSSLFVYGTLMSTKVLETLLGRVPPHYQPALVESFAKHPVIHHVFPGMIPVHPNSNNDKSICRGMLLYDLTEQELKRLDYFEGDEYTRQPVVICLESAAASTASEDNYSPNTYHRVHGNNNDDDDKDVTRREIPTQTYVWTNPLSELDLSKEWDFEDFERSHLSQYLQQTVLPCRRELDRLSW